jgi:hypothetical protein
LKDGLNLPDACGSRGGRVDLGHRDDFNEGVGYTVEIEKLRGGRVFLGFGCVLFQLNLFDTNANLISIFRRDPIVGEQIYITVSRKRFCEC